MKIRIIKPTRIERGRPGDIVEVSPERARFLLRFGLAEPVTIREQIETPEKRMVNKNTRAAKAEPEKEAKTAKAVRTKK